MKKFEEKIPERNTKLELSLVLSLLSNITLICILIATEYSVPTFFRWFMVGLTFANIIILILVTTKNDIKHNDYITRLINHYEDEYENVTTVDEMFELLKNFEEQTIKDGMFIGNGNGLRRLHTKYITTFKILEKQKNK